MKKSSADSNESFNTRKFWLSSVALFAGVLTIGLLPSCTKAAEPQHQYSQSVDGTR
jgi:hypothetical protein